MDNWDDLRFLVALSRVGTMTAAAKLLGTNTATVSRRIERLSETLGVRAFVKTHDGWKPSESIQSLIELAQTFDGELQSLLNRHAETVGGDTVTINIGTLPVVSSQVLFPGIRRYEDQLDNIQLTFSDRIGREGLGESDLVIGLGAPESGRVVTRKAGRLIFRPYRLSDGVQRESDWIGLPETYDSHDLMRLCYETFHCPPRARVENFTALLSLMKATGMPGPLPDTMTVETPTLVPFAPDGGVWVGEFWLMFHETRRSDPGMRRVVDWVMRCFQDIAQPVAANA